MLVINLCVYDPYPRGGTKQCCDPLSLARTSELLLTSASAASRPLSAISKVKVTTYLDLGTPNWDTKKSKLPS